MIPNVWLLPFVARFQHQRNLCTYSAVWLLHGWSRVKLLPSRRVLCTTIHQLTLSLYSKPLSKVHVCFAVTCYLHFWQNGRDLLCAIAVTRGGADTEMRVGKELKLTLEKKILPPLPSGLELAAFLITSPVL